MVVTMRTLTRPSLGNQTTCVELQERTDASLVRTASAEPLNATSSVGLSSTYMVEGKHDSAPEDAIVARVPVISANGTPLMPCKSAKARKLLETGKATKQWSKLGIFYLQLTFDPKEPTTQPLAIGIDPGSKFEALSIVGTKDTVLNIMSEATDWVKKTVETRREMRRARRYRNTRRRPCRINRRSLHQNRIPPSTKARWGTKLRIVQQLRKIVPITTAVVEDVKARTRKGQRKWNSSFSPLEAGKQYFYAELRKSGLKVITKQGIETQQLREAYRLKKLRNKSKPVFETHCVDAWTLAASATGAQQPTTRSLHYLTPLRFNRRQLHMLQFSTGGRRRRQGGTVSLGLKKGTLVKHARYGLGYIGGNMNGRYSIHDPRTGKRLARNIKREDFKTLTRISFRTQFLHASQIDSPTFLASWRSP